MKSLLTVELYLERDLNDRPFPEAMMMFEVKKKIAEESIQASKNKMRS